MTKKIFALVMVISVFGACLVGCGAKEEAATPPATTTTGTETK